MAVEGSMDVEGPRHTGSKLQNIVRAQRSITAMQMAAGNAQTREEESERAEGEAEITDFGDMLLD